MLITFRSKASSNITLFGDTAKCLLKMMGHSGTLPGSLLSPDIPAVLKRLNQALEAAPADPHQDTERPEGELPVSLRLRAFPLIELLTAAAQQDCSVTWDSDSPLR